MNTPATAHAPASTFVPAVLDGSKWPALEPYYAQLIGRTLHDSASLERLLLDRSELDAAAEEAAANLYIQMTRHTDDQPRAWANTFTRKRPKPGQSMAVSWSCRLGDVDAPAAGESRWWAATRQSGKAACNKASSWWAQTGGVGKVCNAPCTRTMGARPALRCRSEPLKARVWASQVCNGLVMGDGLLQSDHG